MVITEVGAPWPWNLFASEAELSLAVFGGDREVVGDVVQEVGGGLGLPADGALLAPAKGSNLLGEVGLDGAFGSVAGDDAVTEALPFVEVLEFGDDRGRSSGGRPFGSGSGQELTALRLAAAFPPSVRGPRLAIW
jgi:hypothetical protein